MSTIQTKFRLMLVLMMASVFIVNCGGGGGGGGAGGDGETDTAPTITLISPSDGSTLTGNAPIVIRFDQPMTPSSLSLSGSLATESNGGTWTTAILANDTLTLSPSMTWRHGLGRTLSVDAQNTNATSLAQAVNLTYAVNNTLQRVSLNNAGIGALNGNSDFPSISGDGRYVAFESGADNLAPGGDSNGMSDIFVRDRNTNTTTRVSVATGGVEAVGVVGGSNKASISADGRYVAFESRATNLVTGDSNGNYDIFVHDRLTGETTRVSVNSAGAEANNGHSLNPSISADGRYVAFQSAADNLVAGDSNGVGDIFVRDRGTDSILPSTTRVSVITGGFQANGSSISPSISADGRYVAFESGATNLVAGDLNGNNDIFVYDRVTTITSLVSVSTAGDKANSNSESPSISADGRYVSFGSNSDNLLGAGGDSNGVSDIFVRDRGTDSILPSTTRVSVVTGGAEANGHSYVSAISGDGRYVVIDTVATNLDASDNNESDDIYVHDRLTGTTRWVSVNSAGVAADGLSYGASISADGRYIAFESEAADMVSGDTNGLADSFVTPTPY